MPYLIALSLVACAAFQDAVAGEAPPKVEQGRGALDDGENRPIDLSTASPVKNERPFADGSGDMIWTVVWSCFVIFLLVLVLWLIRRYLKNSRFVMGGGAVRLLARHALDAQSRVYLIEVGDTIFLVGGARDRLASLGTIRDPEQVARIRSEVGGDRSDSSRRQFKERLSEELKASERGEGAQKIRDQLSDIKDTIKNWGNAGA